MSHHLLASEKERITQIFFEEFGVPGFAIYDAGLLALYAAGVLTGITVDVGYEKTGMYFAFLADVDITPIVDGQIISNGQISVPLGGKHATQHLCDLLATSPPASATTSQLLPPSEVTFELAEEIKMSPITEMTNITMAQRKRPGMGLNSSGESTPLGTPDARDEGVDDIAAIVASGRMSEYFEKKEREKAVRGRKGELLRDAQPQKPNAELNHNTMTLKSGTSILVGGERFRVAETLMEGIIDPPEGAVMGLPDAVTLAVELACRGEHAGKRADLWQHMVIVGGGARIKGIISNYETNEKDSKKHSRRFWPRDYLSNCLATTATSKDHPFCHSLAVQALPSTAEPERIPQSPEAVDKPVCTRLVLLSEFSKSLITLLNGGIRLRMEMWVQERWERKRRLRSWEARLWQSCRLMILGLAIL
jgi:actin-related protein 9